MQEHHAALATLGDYISGIFHNPDHYRSGKNRERGGDGAMRVSITYGI